ncbi:MAG TPA: hypothetical protein PK954_04875 [Anaerolineales bacterium]|nr:hypothetical protein [Anaerolineales bacterium]
MIFVGGFDPRLWSEEAAAQSTLEQRDGALVISHVPDLERATTRLVLRETFDLQGLEAYEARLALDETNGSGNIHLTLNADSMSWWTQCLIQNDAQPRVSCVATKWPTASFDYQTEFTLADFGAWHTVRIEVSADPVAFRYFLDGQPIGEYQPPRPERFSETTYTLDVGAWSSTTSVVGRVDDVVVSRRP